jgi:hypothetical protein
LDSQWGIEVYRRNINTLVIPFLSIRYLIIIK